MRLQKLLYIFSSSNFQKEILSYKASEVAKIQGYKVSEVTKVTQGFCFQFFRMSPKLRGYRSYGTFSNFQKQIRSYKVSEVTKVTQGFCFQFFQMSPKLQGYKSYGAFKIFKKILPKVTRFQKLRRLHRASAEDFP